MISFFTPSSNDQSIYYLDQMFGYMNNVLPVNTGALTIMGAMFKTVNTTALVVGSIVVLNTIIVGLLKTASEGEFLGRQWSSFWVPFRTVMGVAALFPTPAGYSMLQIIMMWIIVQGIGAADTLWTTVLEFVSQKGSIYYNAVAPGTGSTAVLNNVTLPPLMEQLFQALTCQAAMARSDPDIYMQTDGTWVNLYYCNNSTDSFCKLNPNDMLNITGAAPSNGYYNYQMGPKGICGVMSFPDPASYVDTSSTASTAKGIACSDTSDPTSVLTCSGIKQQVATMQAIVNTMANFASQLVEFDNEYWKFNYGVQSLVPTTLPQQVVTTPYPTPGWLNNYCESNKISPSQCCASIAANPACSKPSASFYTPYVVHSGGVNDYADASPNAGSKIYWPAGLGPIIGINTNEPAILTTKYLNDITSATNSALSQNGADITNTYMQDSYTNGWITAGMYYYYIASYSNSAQAASMPSLSISTTSPTMSSSPPNPIYRVLWQTADDVMGAIATSTSTTVASAMPPGLAKPSSALNGAAAGITNNFMKELSGGGTSTNPLISAQAFGEDLLITAQATYPVMLAVSAVAIALININFMALGNGLTTNPAGPALEFVTMILWGVYMLFAGWCFTFGGMLAIYLPLVPYIIFTFGAIGWFIAVIEAMVAAPFVALGILSPTGHDMLGRAEPAIMIMMNTFLRPTLMIFGMIAGMILAPNVVTMINSGFNIVVGSIYGGNHAPGPVELLLFISAYGSLIITTLNKCFALIYMVPERVLTWIGGQAISYGEGDSLGQVKGSVEGTAGAVKSGADSGGRQMQSGASKIRGKARGKEGDADVKGK
jgi:hypothetical protein